MNFQKHNILRFWCNEENLRRLDSITIFEAKWTNKFINDLTDECFAFIKAGGKKDEDGKTVPRSLRYLPYKNEKGEIDKPHLRNALARLPQSDLSDDEKKKAEAVLKKAAKEAKVGEFKEGVIDGDVTLPLPRGYKKKLKWMVGEQEVVATGTGDSFDLKGSLEGLRDKIRKALIDAGGWGAYPYIIATFPDKVIFTNDAGRYFQIEYDLEGDEDNIKLGQAKELEKKTEFIMKEWLEKLSKSEKSEMEDLHKSQRILAGIEQRPDTKIEADEKQLTEEQRRQKNLSSGQILG